MKKTILNSFVGAIVFCLTCFGILYLVKARNSSSTGLPTDGDPSALYVNSNETLTAAKWNAVINKISQINYDGTATTINGTLDIDYISCSIENPTKLKAYNCNGTINMATNNGSYSFYSNATDVVDLLCPTGYIAISGGGYSSNYMRETRIVGGNRRRIASTGTIGNISVLCMKIK